MTFIEKYEYFFTDIEAFGKFYPKRFNKDVSIDELRVFAKDRLNSNVPCIIGTAKSMLADLNKCNAITDQLY